MKILIVEDDRSVSAVFNEQTAIDHCSVDVVDDGLTGLARAQQHEYDVIVIDMTLPQLDGINLCRQLRERGYQNSILMLTATEQVSDRVQSIDAGADDYMVKPYAPDELLFKTHSLSNSKRGQMPATTHITWENLCLDVTRNIFSSQEKEINLTAKEYCLLELFLYNPQRIFSRSSILHKLWDFSISPSQQIVSDHVENVRRRLQDASVNDPIETVHGLGYRLRAPQTCSVTATAEQQITAKTNRIWEKFKDKFLAQVIVLQQAAELLQQHQLTSDQQLRACHAANNLAGSLSTFGFMNGSQLAKQCESILQSVVPISLSEVRLLRNLVTSLQQELSRNLASQAAPATPVYQPTILMIDQDLAFADRLRREATIGGLKVELATDFQIARRSMEQHSPDVILLDLSCVATPENSFPLLKELTQRIPHIPVVCFTKPDNLEQTWNINERLALMTNGCILLEKPQPVSAVLNVINSVLQRQQSPYQHRVMVVDDNPLILTKLAELLNPHRIEVVPLHNIQQFWEVLNTKRPHLLIIDPEIPGYQDINFFKAVRNDPQWQDLPIIALSAHDDQEQREQAFLAGADDYLSKFIAPQTLVHHVLCRLKKAGLPPVPVKSHQAAPQPIEASRMPVPS
jgi:DNA-binding response OmpR family regulator